MRESTFELAHFISLGGDKLALLGVSVGCLIGAQGGIPASRNPW
jgi:hypothetical protein